MGGCVALAALCSVSVAQESGSDKKVERPEAKMPGERLVSGASEQSETNAMSVEDAVETALAKNHGIELSKTDLRIANRNDTIGNAGFLPSADLSLSQSHQFGGSGLFGQDRFRTNTVASVGLDWVLFAGFGRRARLERFRAEHSKARIQKRAKVEQTVASVLKQYIRVVAAQKRVEIYREIYGISKKQVRVARSKEKAGTGTRIETNQARVEQYADRSAVEEARIKLQKDKAKLNKLLGRSPETRFRAAGNYSPTRSVDPESLRARIQQNNRRLRAARKEKKVARSEIGEAKAKRWPELGVGLDYQYSEYYSGIEPPFDQAPGLQYTARLSVPLFDGYNRVRRVDNATSRAAKADRRTRQLELEIRRRFRNRLTEYRGQSRRMEIAEKSRKAAEKNLQIAQQQFEEGIIDQFQLRDVQVSLLRARLQLVEARSSVEQAIVDLKRLGGVLYERWVDQN